MSPHLPRRALPTIALMAALALPLPAQAATARNPSAGPAVLEDLAGSFWHWLNHFWTRTFEKNGAQIDPNGQTPPTVTPGGANDNGAQTDPDG
ncbi:MAG: hypothetical protein QOF89_4187 [Acidobacteriota bacterium]|jgi:ABC-type sugar transport system substrate-binding protein|nr:hypothetical protein [Acidobacteriota bacterium]